MAITTVEIGWVAGFLEGEGSFHLHVQKNTGYHQYQITAAQVQREPLDRLHRMFGGTIYLKQLSRRNPNWHDAWIWQLTGIGAIGLMMTIYEMMSPNRRAQIMVAINAWKTRPVAPKHRSRCQRGHLLSGPNMYKWKNWRSCRTCHRDAMRLRRLEKRGLGPNPNQMRLLN